MMTQSNVNNTELRGLRVVRPVTLKARERDDRREASRGALLAAIGSARGMLARERLSASPQTARCYCGQCRASRAAAAEVNANDVPRGWASLGDVTH